MLAPVVGISAACRAMGCSRSRWYRRPVKLGAAPEEDQPATRGATLAEESFIEEPLSEPQPPPRRHPRALGDAERERIREVYGSERFIDRSPAHIVATMLDEGEYLASERTIYRILGADAPLKDRRNQRRHPKYAKPEILAERPNQVWSWDITRLKGPYSGASYHLYVIIDIFSRYVVGWAVFERESEELAKLLIETTCERQRVERGQLTVHADRGAAMRSREVAELLARLEVKKSHSRPYCANDNPYSESQFKTLKYAPEFPGRFGSIEDARAFCRPFFEWYNTEHRHSGIAMLTPSTVHHGRADDVLAVRDQALAQAYERNPERFVKGRPMAKRLPEKVWINRPESPVAPDHLQRN